MSAMRFSASRCRAVRAGPPAPRGRGPERREWRERAERERPSEGGAGGEAGRVCMCDPACVARGSIGGRVLRSTVGRGGSRDVREIKSYLKIK